MHIVHKGKELYHDIYNGRNSEWFDNLTGRCISEPAYRELFYDYNWRCEGHCPKELIDKYTLPNEGEQICYYYDHRSINVKDFKEWYNIYLPFLKAGYVSRYDAWLYGKKQIIPSDEEIVHYINTEDNNEDLVWIEYVDLHEPSKWLYEFILDNSISDDAWIVYCFDH